MRCGKGWGRWLFLPPPHRNCTAPLRESFDLCCRVDKQPHRVSTWNWMREADLYPIKRSSHLVWASNQQKVHNSTVAVCLLYVSLAPMAYISSVLSVDLCIHLERLFLQAMPDKNGGSPRGFPCTISSTSSRPVLWAPMCLEDGSSGLNSCNFSNA